MKTEKSKNNATNLVLLLVWTHLGGRSTKAIMVFKSLHNLTPVYLHNMFYKFNTNYGVRNSINKLVLPNPRTEYLKHGFSYSCAALWNSLPFWGFSKTK